MNDLIRRIYSGPLITILNFVFKAKFGPVRVYPRRSSTRKDLHFHVLFSDLDLGLEIPDDFNPNELDKMKSFFYQIKTVFRFLGELEIYTSSELRNLDSLFSAYPGLYDKLRDFRKVNWLKGKLKDKNRAFYHRYKDHRTLKILKRRYGARSFHNLIFSIHDDLVSLLNQNGKPYHLNLALDPEHNRFFCNYLSQSIRWPSTLHFQTRYTLVLAALPTRSRGIASLDAQIEKIRRENESLSRLFQNLNEVEFTIASAFIRGSKQQEDWHKPWTEALRSGLSYLNEA
jgi:hypothetical protein